MATNVDYQQAMDRARDLLIEATNIPTKQHPMGR